MLQQNLQIFLRNICSYIYHLCYHGSIHLFPASSNSIFFWRRQSFYSRKIRAWRSILNVIFGYGIRVRRSREYKISAQGNTPLWRFSWVSRTDVCACLVTDTMSRRLSTMGFADVTTLVANPLHSSSASPSLSLYRV